MELRKRRKPQDSDDLGQMVDRMSSNDFVSNWRNDQKNKGYLGFRYWLLILSIIGGVYAFVVFQDNRMPKVKPSGQFEEFSEERTRVLLKSLTELGPRPSGSENCEKSAVKIITNRLENVKAEVDARGANQLEIDIQRPSGCYDLKFLSSFTLCYHKITNIIARIGPMIPAKHSILVNCHFDSLPDSPGATDDAVSCAVMMEVLDILSHTNETLPNSIIFLFNGAEENFLQASHGFITQHPWRHSVRAFINLEGSGAGGREILFQAGPGNSWLLHTYLESAPHPHCSVLAQEIFQAGIIPSDTDFRVFRDYGRLSGLDIAYFRNGWVYHTEFDLPKYIPDGCIQRSGENILALVKALIKSPYLEQPGDFHQGNQWVFYDVIGIFTVFYRVDVGRIMNYLSAVAVFVMLFIKIQRRLYNFDQLIWALLHHALTSAFIFAFGSLIVIVIINLNMTMCWYSLPELVFPLYIFPMLISGLFVHSIISQRQKSANSEMVHYDSVLLIFAILLVMATFAGFASAFFLLIHSSFPLLRDVLIYIVQKLGLVTRVNPKLLLFGQLVCTVPVMVFDAYAAMLLFDFFVPLTGRLGIAVNPEYVIMPIAFLIALSFVLYTSNLLYVSRQMNYLLKCGFLLYCIFFVALITTRLGWPYKYSDESPRLRRLITLDTKRTVYPFNSNFSTDEHALFVQTLDYRGITDLPDHTFLSGENEPDCSSTQDEYCRLPYYTAIHQLFPPKESRWIPLPKWPIIPNPIKVDILGKEIISNHIRMNFKITGGSDKMSLHLTPLNGGSMKNWSFTDIDVESFGVRNTYFVFLTYGAEAPPAREFQIVLQNDDSKMKNLENSPILEMSVATHYAHGPYQYSETLSQLRSVIAIRRKSPHHAIGWWKWAITTIAGVAEIVVHTF